ncbi:putative uncharacterized protein [Caballeronia insecticola]|uniref:Uncharacterized protein n=2 Tax=Caballeronia insecticola TaxID=758793 RepID=R4X2J0_9BURK|nr:putative uncharacterized protein [Caballeronia insecticola]
METGERSEPSLRPSWAGWDAKRASERIAEKAAEYRARRAEAHARNAYADSSHDPDALPGSEGWNRKKTIVASACGLALIAGAAFYLQLGDSDSESMSSDDHSVSGAIDAKTGPLARGAVEAPSTSAAPAAPVTDRRSQADTRTLAPGDVLRGVRVALDQHDLGAARARLKALPAQQQTRAEYEPLKDELVKRELQRDAALQLARACERTSAWACVQQNAGEALALDGSNVESQAMLERVISHAGWLAPTASAALAKKVPSTAPATAATAAPAPSNTVAPAPAAPAQANVATATPPAKQSAVAQKPLTEKRTSRSAAARQAAEEARAEAASEARAEKIARAQAATNAITATTVVPPAAPTAAATTTTTPRAAPSASPSSSQAQTQPSAKTTPAQATATRTPQPHYIGEEETQPAATATTRPANLRAPQYIGDEPAQPAAPAARTNGQRAPYYLGEDPPQTAAPAARSTVPRPPQSTQSTQSTNQGAAQPPIIANPQAAVPRPPAASAQPVATQTTATPRVATTISPPATQANVSTRAAPSSAGTGASPSAQFGSMPAGAHLDSDKTEELERAIKQYGWSGSESAPKPSQ